MATINSFLWALPLLPLAMAQQDSSTTPSASPTPSPSQTPPDGDTTTMPSPNPSDLAGQQNDNRNTIGLVNYYFVFIALVVAAALLAAFLMYRRKRRYGAIMHRGRQSALQQDVNTWDPARARRRYWQGRWRSAETVSREEGLNEEGEAPPPYAPKTRDEESGPQTQVSTLAVPMQALSREQAGLKPPDYSEVNAADQSHGTRHGTENAAASSQQPESRPGAPPT